MSTFSGHRLTNEVFGLDVERMCPGWYSGCHSPGRNPADCSCRLFTADVVRVKIHGDGHGMVTVGRRGCAPPLWRGSSDDRARRLS